MQDQGLASYGLSGNFGQPSVVYRVPIRIDGANPASGVTSQIEGYSSWMGDSGTLIPRDATISTARGSGEGRLLTITGDAGTGRVLVSLEPCVCDPAPPTPLAVTDLHVADQDVTASTAVVRFNNASAAGARVSGYEIRYLATDDTMLTDDEFLQGNRASQVQPGDPDSAATVKLENLKPSTRYLVGVRSQGPCMGKSDIALADFTTPSMKFTQLSGCFVATAAYGSEMEPEVAALRSVRDTLRPQSGLIAAAIELYYRSGPAAAAVIQRSETARALARRLLAPAAELAELASHAANRANQAPLPVAAPSGIGTGAASGPTP